MLTVQATDCGVTYDRLYNCNMFIIQAIGKLAKDKHSSLFCNITRDEEKKFYNVDRRNTSIVSGTETDHNETDIFIDTDTDIDHLGRIATP